MLQMLFKIFLLVIKSLGLLKANLKNCTRIVLSKLSMVPTFHKNAIPLGTAPFPPMLKILSPSSNLLLASYLP